MVIENFKINLSCLFLADLIQIKHYTVFIFSLEVVLMAGPVGSDS